MSEQQELTATGVAPPRLRLGSVHALDAIAEPALVGLVGFLLTSVVAASDGGYFSNSWAWMAFVSLFVATLRLILSPRLPLRRLDWAFFLGFAAFVAWVALSARWAVSITPSVDETIRAGSYAAVVLLLLMVVRRRTVEPLLVGALLGVTSISSYALLTRLHPDWVGSWDPGQLFRLSAPVGYWNGLGLYAAMGVLLALGLAARSASRTVQGVAAAAPVLLGPTMLFTFSRGAWLALGVGLLAAILLDPRRHQFLATLVVLAPWPAAVILLAHRSDQLTKSTITLQQAADEGGALLVWIVVLAVAAALAAIAFRFASSRIRVSERSERAVGWVTLVGLVLTAVACFAVAGAPWTLAHRAADRFTAGPKQAGADATDRLFDLSSNGRIQQWHVSIDQYRSHRVVGDGAGSYAAAWNLHRPYEGVVHDAHSLYLEVLGELGIVGLGLLALALSLPLAAAIRARREPWTAAAFAAYAAFLAHAAVDWDWELAGVTLVALTAATALVVSARRGELEPAPRSVIRVTLPVVTGALALLALAAVLSTVPLARARAAYTNLDFAEAAVQAQKASDWAPWSSEALDVLGRSQLAQGKVVEARASFESAVAKSPDNWELWRDLAAASPPGRARVAVQRALELNPRESELARMQQSLAPQS